MLQCPTFWRPVFSAQVSGFRVQPVEELALRLKEHIAKAEVGLHGRRAEDGGRKNEEKRPEEPPSGSSQASSVDTSPPNPLRIRLGGVGQASTVSALSDPRNLLMSWHWASALQPRTQRSDSTSEICRDQDRGRKERTLTIRGLSADLNR